MSNEVTIIGAPGYAKHFKAKVIPGLGDIPARDTHGNLAVITWGDGELGVVPAECVVTGPVDLVKRFEVAYDWDVEAWGVRHAFDGPFVHHGGCECCDLPAWIARKALP